MVPARAIAPGSLLRASVWLMAASVKSGEGSPSRVGRRIAPGGMPWSCSPRLHRIAPDRQERGGELGDDGGGDEPLHDRNRTALAGVRASPARVICRWAPQAGAAAYDAGGMASTSLSAAVAEVAGRDPVLADLVARAGPIRHRPRDPAGPFAALVRAIVFQQLAGRAAQATTGACRRPSAGR